MGLLDNLGNLLGSKGDAHAAFDQVASSAPAGTIADALAHAFNSDKTPPFAEMLSGLFAQSTPEQKAGIINQMIATLGPQVVSQLATTAGLGSLAAAMSGGAVTAQQARQVSPQDVQVLAQHAEKKNPSIVDAAAGFYAQHPALVKTIGAGALALLVSKVSQKRT